MHCAQCNICLMCCLAEAIAKDHQGLEDQYMVFSGTWVAIASFKICMIWAAQLAIKSNQVIEASPLVCRSPHPTS